MCLGRINNFTLTFYRTLSVIILVSGYIITAILMFINKIYKTDNTLTLYFAGSKLSIYSMALTAVIKKDINRVYLILIGLIIMTLLSTFEFTFFIAKISMIIPPHYDGIVIRTSLSSLSAFYGLLQFYFFTVIYRYFNGLVQEQ